MRVASVRILRFLPVLAMSLLAIVPVPSGRAEEVPTPGRARIVYGDGRPTEEVAILESGRQVWFSARDLSAIIGAPRYWRSDLKRLILKSGAHQMTLVADSDVAILDATSPLHLPAPVHQLGDAIWIPVEILLDADQAPFGLNGLDGASPWFDLPIRWNAGEHLLEVGEPAGNLEAIALSSASPGRLDIQVRGTWEWRLAAADRDRVVLRFMGIAGPGDSFRLPSGNGLYRDIRTTLIPEGVEVTFAVAANVVGYRLQRLERPGRLSVTLSVDSIDLASGRVTPFASPLPDLPTMEGGFMPATGTDTIGLDPAGGGNERGVRAKGVVESEAMLELAMNLARRLSEELGVTVHLTRDADRALSDEQRAAVANNVGAMLFISLHYDAHPSPSVVGPRAVVSRNRPGPRTSVPGRLANLGFTAWNEGQREAVPRAYQLADRLVTELSQALSVPSRGVEEWPLPVLSAATMPAVYLEVATLTAPGGERRAKGEQDAVINAIIRAIDHYRREIR
ncbi:MAG: N-acetylmuramoyl-L-alanine amidase [Candidatus Eisenbacteria bacterium]|nr:N-acetylmuramoyl-L-alanine amidase [Candidatus Eisenbacteria bacterium]